MNIINQIKTWQDEFENIRKDLHQHPEIAYQEFRTSDVVADKLESWGVEVHRGMAETAVIGIIRGSQGGGRHIGLRADMDALAMPENNKFPHASVNEGKMHACGHDGHTTMLLAGVRHLAENNDFAGTVYAIFQPAEEDMPGAERMVQEGLFEKYPIEAVFGMHNWPNMPAGTFGLRPGPVMASSCMFSIKIQGRGGYAAEPDTLVDPIVAASHVVQAFQSVVSRNVDPLDRVVVSVTQIHGGSADNVIPDEVELRGTVRCFSMQTQAMVAKRMKELAVGVAKGFACTVDFTLINDYPLVFNDPDQTEVCGKVLDTLVGKENVDRDIEPDMGGEDFSFMLQERPGCYIWIGNGDGSHRQKGHGSGPCVLHNTSYDFNDKLIPIGGAYWSSLAREWLKNPVM